MVDKDELARQTVKRWQEEPKSLTSAEKELNASLQKNRTSQSKTKTTSSGKNDRHAAISILNIVSTATLALGSICCFTLLAISAASSSGLMFGFGIGLSFIVIVSWASLRVVTLVVEDVHVLRILAEKNEFRESRNADKSN